ncbi:MAG: hypothetical protein EAZ35_03190 [Sphingobacteriia bacterium]|nr:MAG: hypothetical protein EAZ35_03190 [Sphingobacteriia bacterium]
MFILMKRFFYCTLFSVLAATALNAQSLPVGEAGLDERLRILQLQGKINAAQSLTARPFFYNKFLNRNELLQLIDSGNNIHLSEKSFWNKQIQLGILPATIATKFNSHHPYGWNDAGMIMAKGVQTMVSAGVFAKIGPLSIQLQPEYYYASNSRYDTTPSFGFNSGKSFAKSYLGQSSIRLNLGPISFGASSENLWWGPGQFSSLMMSNNAPGFKHLSFNSTRPLKTPIGSFEWQLVMGSLNEDTTSAYENNFMRPRTAKNENRYFNGIVITYQPKWLSGFFLGLTRSEHYYKTSQDLKTGFVEKYLPVFNASSPTANGLSTSIPSDGAFSFFARWLLPKHQAEFYIEYGYNDFKANLRDLSTNANHSSAYIIGFNKLLPAGKGDGSVFLLSGELTQMAQTTSYVVRSAGNWYMHSPIEQGFTYQNQIMGAGSGFGNNVQTLQLKHLHGLNTLGVKLQRIQQDPKGLFGPQNLIGMREIQWNDLSLGLLGSKRFKQLLLKGELQWVQSKNYGWAAGNATNLFLQVHASYFF